MSTVEMALSADHADDLVFLEKMLWKSQEDIILRHEEPIDLLLRERTSWFDRRKAPHVIVASYRDFFTDLKVIADLKKIPAYQWVKIVVIVNQDITRIRSKFFEYGVTHVLEWTGGPYAIKHALRDILGDLAQMKLTG